MMLLLTPELRQVLRTNAIIREMHASREWPEPDPVPVVKFFNPLAAATWLATELDRDNDTLFGLADLGFGTPELGTFSLSEIEAVRLPYGMGIERDTGFRTIHPISVWAEWSRRAGSIMFVETLLRRAAANELPSADG